jgi:epoxyqueuosine reductase QueG
MLSLADLAMLGCLIPTPTASMHKCATICPSNIQRFHQKRMHTEGAIGALGYRGRLHPQFVEWMMGFPLHWTCLDSED